MTVVGLAMTSCLTPDIPDISGLRATERPTWTPEPIPTEFSIGLGLDALTSEPSNRPQGSGANSSTGDNSGNGAGSQNSIQAEVEGIINQLEKLKGLVSGLTGIDSGTRSSMESGINNALSELNGSTMNEVTARSIYDVTKADLRQLASSASIGEPTLEQFSKAGGAMTSATSQGLANALSGADFEKISEEITQLADVIPQLTQEELSALADDLVSAALELEEVDPELFIALLNTANALRANTDNPQDLLQTLAQLKEVVDEVSKKLDFVELIDLNIQEIEQETRSLTNIQSLLNQAENTTISEVDIIPKRAFLMAGNSLDLLPQVAEASSPSPLCGLSFTEENQADHQNGSLICLDPDGNWFIPQLTSDPNASLSAITGCGDFFVLASDSTLIKYDISEISAFGENNYPFKAPTILDCSFNDENRIWGLPSGRVAENPWYFDGNAWIMQPYILQNGFVIGPQEALWGVKWEINENSPMRDNKPIDLIPYVSRLQNSRWDVFYSSDWEEGLFGVAIDARQTVWFLGPLLYQVDPAGEWQAQTGYINQVFTMLPNGHLIGGKIDGPGLVLFDGSAWFELSDWPSGETPTSISTDARNRIWVGVEGGLFVWEDRSWKRIEGEAVETIHTLAILGDGPTFP